MFRSFLCCGKDGYVGLLPTKVTTLASSMHVRGLWDLHKEHTGAPLVFAKNTVLVTTATPGNRVQSTQDSQRAPLNRQFDGMYLRTKNLLNHGLKVAQNNINAVLHGPTGEEITKDLDLSDKTCLITGANSGIGLEMTRCLSARECTVLMACRNPYEAKNICENNHRLRLYETNLASLRSVKKCSDEILNTEKQIDIVILNAGVFGLPWTLTVDMLETSFQVNYLSQFYMLMNLEKILAPDARVIFISSESHKNINWSFHDQLLPSEELVSLPKNKYTSIKAYNISKLCGILAMQYLGYRWLKTPKSVFCAHPGSFVKTRLCRNWWPYEFLYTIMLPFSKNISQAASTPLYCATSPDLRGLSNLYFKDCERVAPSELAQDSHLAFRMHDLTQDLIRDRTSLITTETEPVICAQESKPIEETLTPNYST